MSRLIVVLGYSGRRPRGLHPVCASRLERALAEAKPDDTVMLSGWSRKGAAPAEAELMRAAWTAPCAALVCDTASRTTAETAAAAAALARRLRPPVVIAVTSDWHAPRTGFLFRSLLRGSGAELRVLPAGDGRRRSPTLGELLRWPLVPLQILAARRAVSRAREYVRGHA
jgi:uncharacterized SAM-binding protein YcdF (DUF218 family)